MKKACALIVFLLAAFAFAPAAIAQFPTTGHTGDPCYLSPTGFVSGAACFSLGGRMYSDCPGCGIESSMLLGPIHPDRIAARSLPLDKLAQPLIPTTVIVNAVRNGRSIELPIADPPKKSFLLLRTPGSTHDVVTDEVRIRTAGTAPGVVYVWRSLVDAGGGRVLWRNMSPNRWYLIVFDGDWHLLNE